MSTHRPGNFVIRARDTSIGRAVSMAVEAKYYGLLKRRGLIKSYMTPVDELPTVEEIRRVISDTG